MVISKEMIERLGRQIIPNDQQLSTDRGITAKTILNPNKANDWERYRREHGKLDMKGFDTKKEQEIPSRKAVRKFVRSGTDYVYTEPERFLRQSNLTRDLIDQVKDRIVDYESMKQLVFDQWNKDKSLQSLTKTLSDKDYMALFNTKYMQDTIKNNTSSLILQYIKQRFKVSDIRAKQIYDKLPSKEKINIYKRLTTRQKLKFKPSRPTQPKVPDFLKNIPKVKQRSKFGKLYNRSKPKRWTDKQVRFLNSYNNMPIKDIFKLYNRIFSDKRTETSINQKLYRLNRQN